MVPCCFCTACMLLVVVLAWSWESYPPCNPPPCHPFHHKGGGGGVTLTKKHRKYWWVLNGVSNEHSCSDRVFRGLYCSLDMGEGGGGSLNIKVLGMELL